MTVVLCTVPHTGTQFVRSILCRHMPDVDFGGLHGLVTVHATDAALDQIAEHAGWISALVTTVRDREAVRVSWERRGKSLPLLDTYWSRWERMVAARNPIIVSVDAPDREDRLVALGRALGLSLETDWRPVNSWRS